MAADYAGAIAAIKQLFRDNWLTNGAKTTEFTFVNEGECKQTDANGTPTPWVLFEIVSIPSYIEASGAIGNQIVIYPGLIKAHVFAPTGTGTGEGGGGAMALALAIGEIFRNKVFYDSVTPGCYVRSGYTKNGPPRINQGDIHSNDGEWFVVTATIPFDYWHRG